MCIRDRPSPGHSCKVRPDDKDPRGPKPQFKKNVLVGKKNMLLPYVDTEETAITAVAVTSKLSGETGNAVNVQFTVLWHIIYCVGA